MTNIKIKQLPEAVSVNDTDLIIIEDETTTHKIAAGNIAAYLKNHPEISDYYLPVHSLGTENGAAPLDSNQKIAPDYLSFGRAEGTVYEGSMGAQLETSLTKHEEAQDNPHHTTKQQIGLEQVDNKSAAQILNELRFQNVTQALGYIPEEQGSYENAAAYTDNRIAELIQGAPKHLDTLKEIGAALNENADAVSGIITTLATKADQDELSFHSGNNTIHTNAAERSAYERAYEHARSPHALAAATKASTSAVNGNIKINDVETTVYRHPPSGVGSGSYTCVSVNEQGHITQGYNPVVSVMQGGTGATNGAAAIKNLGITAALSELNKLKGVTVSTQDLNQLLGTTGNIQEQFNQHQEQFNQHQEQFNQHQEQFDQHLEQYDQHLEQLDQHLEQFDQHLEQINDLYSHTENNTIHTSASERSQYKQAYSHSGSLHARTDATKTAASQVNGNMKINDAETSIYRHPATGVSSGTYTCVSVNEQGHITQGSNPVIPVTQGGTGAASQAEAIMNLGITASATEINKLKGMLATTTELNRLAGLAATTTEINKLKGMLATTTELNRLAGLAATTTEINKLKGMTANTSELNCLSGISSNIQTQLSQNAAQITLEKAKSQTVTQQTEPTNTKTGDFWEMFY